MPDKVFKLKVALALTWLVFTGALILWWMYFALGLIEMLNFEGKDPKTMLVLEGVTLLVFLLVGGMILVALLFGERRQSLRLKDFFSTFGHETKTALASLRLQAESLAEDLKDEGHKRLLGRLVSDSSRILVFIDNSLLLADGADQFKVLNEQVNVTTLIDDLKLSWPQLEIELLEKKDAIVFCDTRGLESIFNNLFHNSFHHGRSRKVVVKVAAEVDGIRFEVLDNGMGFSGDLKCLGVRGHRPLVTSGTGLGLSIVTSLVQKMGGQGPWFSSSSKGFLVSFKLPIKGQHG